MKARKRKGSFVRSILLPVVAQASVAQASVAQASVAQASVAQASVAQASSLWCLSW